MKSRRGLPTLSAFLFLVTVTLTMTVFQTPRAAYAFAPAPLPISLLPATLAQTTVAPVAAAGTIAVGPALAVSAAGIGIGYGAGMLGTKAVSWAWNWANGTLPLPGYAAPATGSAGQVLSDNCATDVSVCVVLSPRDYPALANGELKITGYNAAGDILTLTYHQPGVFAKGDTIDAVQPQRCSSGLRTVRIQHRNYNGGEYSNELFTGCTGPASVDVPAGAPAGSVGTATGRPEVDCLATSGTITTVLGTAMAVTTDTPSSALPPIDYPGCANGDVRVAARVPTTDAAGNPIDPLVAPWTAPTIPSAFPECQPGTGGICVLTLTRYGTGTGVGEESCAGNESCRDWQTKTVRAAPRTTVRTVATGAETTELTRTYPDGSRLGCKWGPYTVPVDECTAVPTEAPAPVTDPVTDRDSDGQGCMGSWTWNPIAWVYRPVKCALQWAFVPSPEAFDAWKTEIGKLGATPPVMFVDTIRTMITDFFGASRGSCTDPSEGPVNWCAGVKMAGDWTDTTPMGSGIFLLQKVLLTLAFGFSWYNRLTASFGGKGEL